MIARDAACLFVVALAPALAQQPSFSHQLHLTLKLTCVTCHAGASTSTQVSDNNLPAEKICLDCHKTAVIKQPEVSRVSKFNHQQHLKMGNTAPVIAAAIDTGNYLSPAGDIRRQLETKNACEACHRGMEESTTVAHANFPQMADCLVCHNKIELPFSCETCHDNIATLRPVDHTSNWIDLHSSGKANLDKPSCAVCHGPTFTCMGCH